MLRWLRKHWHGLVLYVFWGHFRDELTEVIHPEFGWLWRKEEQGGKALRQAYEDGWRDAMRGKS